MEQMHSSTSSSKKPDLRDVIILIAACALVCLCLESGTKYLFRHVSRIESRREAEYLSALRIRPAHARGSESVLVAGNSLLLEGVNFAELQQEVAPELELRRTVVEGTLYLDWYYGLRGLFEAGARPDVVVLVLNPVQLTSPAIGGDYTAHFMVDHKDLIPFAHDVGADRNRMSSLVLSNFSFFYGSRAEIRNWVLGLCLPDLPQLARSFRRDQNPPDYAALHELAMRRLTRLHELCEQHGATMVFVIPPAKQDLGAEAIAREAAAQGVKVLMPIAPGVLPKTDYADGFHLNAAGAGKFTPELAVNLKQALGWSEGSKGERVAREDSTARHPSPIDVLSGQLASTSERGFDQAPETGEVTGHLK
jgi:hypothetical protein